MNKNITSKTEKLKLASIVACVCAADTQDSKDPEFKATLGYRVKLYLKL